MRRVKFEFFKLAPKRGSLNYEQLSAKLAEYLPNFSEPVRYGSRYVRRERYTFNGVLHYGIASRITMDDIPYKVRLEQPGFQTLGLRDDEGIAAPTAFLYDPSSSVLVLQRGSNCVSVGAVLALFSSATGENNLDAHPILERNALERLDRMQIIRSWELKIANPAAPGYYDDISGKAAAEMSARYEARLVRIQLSMGHSRGSLHVDAVKQSLLRWFRLSSEDRNSRIESLKVKGKAFDDSESDELDLLQHKMVEFVEVRASGREIDSTDLERAVRIAYDKRKDEIQDYRPV